MASKSKATEARYQDVKNGRPVFTWGDDLAPPAWLVKLANRGRVEAGEFLLDGNPMLNGTNVTGSDG